MRKSILLFALIGFAVGQAPLASAGDNDPDRGKTNTRKPDTSTTEIYILRGTEPKDQSGITITTQEPAAKEEAPKTRTIRRGRHTFSVPAE